jgi:hypothetical protein
MIEHITFYFDSSKDGGVSYKGKLACLPKGQERGKVCSFISASPQSLAFYLAHRNSSINAE